MEKVCLTLLVAVLLFSSCKKEENDCPKCGTPVTTHYAYVRGIVLDSITGNPVMNAKLYHSYSPFSDGSGLATTSSIDSTDVNGMYTTRVFWYVGDLWQNGTTQSSKPGDSTDVFINVYTNNSCRSLKFKGALLIENDTAILPNIYLKPFGYVCTHIKDVLPSSFGIYLYWYKLLGKSTVNYNDYYPTDTIIYHGAIPGVEGKITWGLNTQFVNVMPGDTAFVDAFY